MNSAGGHSHSHMRRIGPKFELQLRVVGLVATDENVDVVLVEKLKAPGFGHTHLVKVHVAVLHENLEALDSEHTYLV